MKKTCLIVDDDETNRMVARLILEELGFTTIELDNAENAISVVISGECDVVLLDWMMPELDGIEFLQFIRESGVGKQVKIIMCTGKIGEDAKKEAIYHGADIFINKPITTDSLEAAMKEIGIL